VTVRSGMYNGGVRFIRLLKQKAWAVVVAVVGSCIPWTISTFGTDTLKQTLKDLAGRDSVSLAAYQLLALAALHPVVACLLLSTLVFCGAAIYSAVQITKNPQSRKRPEREAEWAQGSQGQFDGKQEIKNLRDKIKLLELRDPEIAKQQAIETHRMLSERDRQEALFLKSKISILEHRIEEYEKDATARKELDSFSHTIRTFKNLARQIRRTWPESDFNKRPLFLPSWMPALNLPAFPWLRLASDWRDGMLTLPSVSVQSAEQLNSMDFDEVMELLDDAEGERKGTKPFRIIVTGGLPDVEIIRWGTLDGRFGLFVQNKGESASHISLYPAVRLGSHTLISDTLPLLLREDKEVFLPVSLRHANGGLLVPSNIAMLISELPSNNNGVQLVPTLRLVYRTGNGSWIGSTYQISPGADKSITFRFVKRELLIATPQLEIAESSARQSH
jgi:hypothetical protein